MRRNVVILLGILLVCSFAIPRRPEVRPVRALPQSVFVWQRNWTPAVINSLEEHRAAFEKCIVLNAEIVWSDSRPRVIQVPLDYSAIRQSRGPVGLALRIGYSPSAFTKVSFELISKTAREILAAAEGENIPLSELHIDFDCPESKLGNFTKLLGDLKSSLPAIPLTITTLPTWLTHRSEFSKLIEPVSSYVLQVHSLERPRDFVQRLTLCDPETALQAVRIAGNFSKPFLVALPTYSYLVAFDEKGQFAGIRAEQSWSAPKLDMLTKEVRSSPSEMARLVQELETCNIPSLGGIIWYRLPTSDDRLNWSWETLRSVMSGKVPASCLKCEMKQTRPGLYEVILRNDGSEQFEGTLAVQLDAPAATILAQDALGGFQIKDSRQNLFVLESKDPIQPLRPLAQRQIGWVRVGQQSEVQFEIKITMR